MREKELRHLSRGELMDIIYTLRKNQDVLEQMNTELKEKLADREMKVSEAGSIAEAALAVSRVFEDAQTAADLYLQELRRGSGQTEQRIAQAEEQAAKIIRDAELQAARITRDAQQQADIKQQQAEQEIEGKWKAFQSRTEAFLEDHPALRMLMGTNSQYE